MDVILSHYIQFKLGLKWHYTVKVKIGICYLEELFLPDVTPFIDVAQCILVDLVILNNIFNLNIIHLDVKH